MAGTQSGSIFLIMFVVAVGGWLLGLFELLAALLLVRWAFGIGPTLMRQESTVSLPPAGLGYEHTGETEHTKYKVIGQHRCVFRRKYGFFEMRWNTPLEPRGTMEWDNGTLRSTGRCSVGVLLFLVFWLASWTAGGLGVAQQGNGDMGFAALGWLLLGAMLIPSWFIERSRFARYSQEVQEALSSETRTTSPQAGVA